MSLNPSNELQDLPADVQMALRKMHHSHAKVIRNYILQLRGSDRTSRLIPGLEAALHIQRTSDSPFREISQALDQARAASPAVE